MSINSQYKLPSSLSSFQEAFYIHLIKWKWMYITKEPGTHQDKEYDAIIPEALLDQQYPLYRPIIDEVSKHDFKPHKQYGKHMASSQTACINLFTPILMNPEIATQVLSSINPSFKSLATDQLESGYQFEYWDTSNPLNDHTPAAGTDSDIAIAYYNDKDELCLWLIEHKLTEKEFSTCGGYKSSGNKQKELCKSSTVLTDHDKCYYKYAKDYKYWELTKESGLFDETALAERSECPFMSGENQLWRNQLMAYAIQSKGIFKHVHFSVVNHDRNPHLEETISRYKQLLKNPTVFDTFTSKDLIQAASMIKDKDLQDWVTWYSELYMIS
jgi:hypothetical protein